MSKCSEARDAVLECLQTVREIRWAVEKTRAHPGCKPATITRDTIAQFQQDVDRLKRELAAAHEKFSAIRDQLAAAHPDGVQVNGAPYESYQQAALAIAQRIHGDLAYMDEHQPLATPDGVEPLAVKLANGLSADDLHPIFRFQFSWPSVPHALLTTINNEVTFPP